MWQEIHQIPIMFVTGNKSSARYCSALPFFFHLCLCPAGKGHSSSKNPRPRQLHYYYGYSGLPSAASLALCLVEVIYKYTSMVQRLQMARSCTFSLFIWSSTLRSRCSPAGTWRHRVDTTQSKVPVPAAFSALLHRRRRFFANRQTCSK